MRLSKRLVGQQAIVTLMVTPKTRAFLHISHFHGLSIDYGGQEHVWPLMYIIVFNLFSGDVSSDRGIVG